MKNLGTTLSVSDVSAGMLNRIDEKLQLTGEELLRMEDEGDDLKKATNQQ